MMCVKPGFSLDKKFPGFNPEQLLTALDGDIDVIKEITELFMSDVPPRIRELNDALRDGNREKSELLAHSLRGSSANIGAVRLEELFSDIERSAKSADLPEAAATGRKLEPEFQRLRSTMETFDRRLRP